MSRWVFMVGWSCRGGKVADDRGKEEADEEGKQQGEGARRAHQGEKAG
uniref:Uncharacterized protein n=1 Tax=Triticum urartu TaxID=4572 RepID=A0A8R7NZK3_TRIUA